MRLGRAFTCYRGAVRLYEPGAQHGDPRGRHRYFSAADVKAAPFLDDLRALVERALSPAATQSLAPEIAERINDQEREALTAQVEELSRALQASSNLRARQSSETTQLMERQQEKIRQLENELSGKQQRIERQEQIIQQAAEHLAQLDGGAPDANPLDEPPDVAAAVEIAHGSCPHLEFLASAFQSAAESRFRRPDDILERLKQLNELGGALANGQVAEAQLVGWLTTRNVDVSEESVDTMRRYGDERLFRSTSGELIEMQLHIKLRGGQRGADAYGRIYFRWNAERGRIQVGHVGRHLRTGQS